MTSIACATSVSVQPLSLRRRFLYSSLLIVLLLCFLEGLAAIYLNFFTSNPRPLAARNALRHVYEPYRNHALTPGWESEGQVHDAQGFRRTTDVSQTKPANVFRIFLMGGSAAYGLSSAAPFPPVIIRNDQTIDYKLERLLQPLFPDTKIEVVNAAVTAYWTHHHLIYLHEKILDYDPDLVLFLDGINDYYHTRPDHEQFSSYRLSMTLKVEELNHPSPGEAVQTLLAWGKQYSNAVFVLNEAASRVFHWDDVPNDPCNLESIPPSELNGEFRSRYETIARRTWVRTLRSILVLLKDQGVAAITTLQPELVFKQTHGISSDDLRLREMDLQHRPPYYTEKKEFLRPIASHLAADTASDFGATFVDLTDVFDDQAQYFIDYCHLSEAGAERIAERLLPSVAAKIRQAQGGKGLS